MSSIVPHMTDTVPLTHRQSSAYSRVMSNGVVFIEGDAIRVPEPYACCLVSAATRRVAKEVKQSGGLSDGLGGGRAYDAGEVDTRPPISFGLSEPEVQRRLCPGYPGEEQDLGEIWV